MRINIMIKNYEHNKLALSNLLNKFIIKIKKLMILLLKWNNTKREFLEFTNFYKMMLLTCSNLRRICCKDKKISILSKKLIFLK